MGLCTNFAENKYFRRLKTKILRLAIAQNEIFFKFAILYFSLSDTYYLLSGGQTTALTILLTAHRPLLTDIYLSLLAIRQKQKIPHRRLPVGE